MCICWYVTEINYKMHGAAKKKDNSYPYPTDYVISCLSFTYLFIIWGFLINYHISSLEHVKLDFGTIDK